MGKKKLPLPFANCLLRKVLSKYKKKYLNSRADMATALKISFFNNNYLGYKMYTS